MASLGLGVFAVEMRGTWCTGAPHVRLSCSRRLSTVPAGVTHRTLLIQPPPAGREETRRGEDRSQRGRTPSSRCGVWSHRWGVRGTLAACLQGWMVRFAHRARAANGRRRRDSSPFCPSLCPGSGSGRRQPGDHVHASWRLPPSDAPSGSPLPRASAATMDAMPTVTRLLL